MAKLLFLQDLEYEFLGPMYISSMLKGRGHKVLMRVGSRIDDFRDTISSFKPDLVAFSIMSGSHRWALDMARQIKKEYGINNIFGGPHPTYFPEFLNEEGVDIIVRGEGEEACLELMDRLDMKADYLDVKNLWVSRDGRAHKNDLRPLDEELDRYPFPDRELYADLRGRIDLSVRNLTASRGCPWHCTFCFNDSMRSLYKDKGRYVRIRNADKVIEEARILRDTTNTKTIYFVDDVFGLNSAWLYDFLPRYKREVGLPFVCLVRADAIRKNEKYARYLADHGCISACFGIESGNERIRNEVLNKNVSNDDIYTAAERLHEAGVKFRTFNILGLPGETLEDALSTVKLNIDIKTDHPWCSIFMPFPGTKLTEDAKRNGYLPQDYTIDNLSKSFYAGSNLINHPEIGRLQNLQKFFQTAVLWPWTFGIIKRLIRLPQNALFTAWFGFVYFIVYVRSENRGFWKTMYFTLRNYQHLIKKDKAKK
ncbi:MAG: radical SAM protein [Candidatus Omnitrophica bacterium]|nr:radical SAM protein [Candidatus Omnitrophota bacterium]